MHKSCTISCNGRRGTINRSSICKSASVLGTTVEYPSFSQKKNRRKAGPLGLLIPLSVPCFLKQGRFWEGGGEPQEKLRMYLHRFMRHNVHVCRKGVDYRKRECIAGHFPGTHIHINGLREKTTSLLSSLRATGPSPTTISCVHLVRSIEA